MKVKEEYLNRKAKNIRNKLIYYTHIQLKKKSHNEHYLMINSMTPKEINSKYQKCSDYCIEKTETYSSSEMNYRIYNNNYFHVSVTYCSLNNNYHMIVDNQNINQMIGENNIVGKYYKGNTVNIRSTMTQKNKVIKLNENENKLEKMIIGDKKFKKKKRANCSSIEITKNFLINDNDNNNENNFADNLNSNHNKYKNLININFNNEVNKKNQTNANKLKKQKNQNIVNIYTIKLKKYCSSLKIIKKRENHYSHKNKNQKHSESPSISEHKAIHKNERERHYTVNSEKDQPKLHAKIFLNQDYNSRIQADNQNSCYNKNNIHTKLQSQTKISQNLFKIKEKKISNRKKRAQTIYISKGKNTSLKKSPKKVISPKKTNIINIMHKNNDQPFSNIIQKYTLKKNKANDANIKKFVSGGIDSKRKMFNANKVNFKYTNTNNGVNIFNAFNANNGINKKIINKNIKRSNTINKIYNFRGNEIKSKEKEQ